MFLPRVPSSPRNTPPPVQPLVRDRPRSPVLMLQSQWDSPPADCLALTWPTENKDNRVSDTSTTSSMKMHSTPNASEVYHQSRAVVFDSPSGERTICLQRTLCYTIPPNTKKESPFPHDGSPDKRVSHADFPGGSPSPPHQHGSVYGTPIGSTSLWDGMKASPPTAKVSTSPHNDSEDDGAGRQESPDSRIRQRHQQPKGRKDLQLPRESSSGSRPGRSLAGSDRYRGILEQDHPEETLSRGLFGSCCCYLLPFIVLTFLVAACVVSCYGSPLGFLAIFDGGDQCQSLNVSNARKELELKLIGQPVALNLIIDAMGTFRVQESRKPLFLFFHGSSGVGKTHTANILTESILKDKKLDLCIQTFNVNLLLRSERNQSQQNFYLPAVEEWINNTRSSKDGCCYSVYIFDELRDDTPQDLTQALGQVLSQLHTDQRTSHGNKIIILMTMVGSQTISEFLIANMERGHDRQSLTVLKQNWQEPWKHLAASLDKLDSFWTWLPRGDYIRIPFLPLEKVHVKQCASNSLKRKNMAVTEERLEWVADQLMYFPDKWPIFSVSGCKKVSDKVNLIHVNSPARTTFDFKKPF